MDMTAEFLEDQFADYGDFDRIELGKIELTELLEEYASLKTKELEKQLQKEAIEQLSLLDQIKELQEENETLKEELRELQLTEHYRKEAKRELTDNEEIRQRIKNKFKMF